MRKQAAVALCVGVLVVLCGSVSGAEPARVTARFEEAALPEVLAAVQKDTGVEIKFPWELVEAAASVSAKAEDAPLDEFLHKILHPRGIEFIRTGERKIRLLPTASYVGMTKQAGRALRTFVPLEEKLEGAEQHGDEVRVPGWSDADDHELVQAVTAFSGAIAYGEMFRSDRRESVLTAEQVEEMLRGPDAGLRVGTALAMAMRWYHLPGAGVPAHERVLDAVADMAGDAEPDVRAAAVFILLNQRPFREARAEAIQEKVFASALKDPARQVRFAVALAAAENSQMLSRFPEYARLAKDDCAAVRMLASLLLLENVRRTGDEKLQEELVSALIKDPNPIVRPIGLLFSFGMMSRGGDFGTIVALVEAAKDPWLRLCMEATMPLMDGDRQGAAAAMAELAGSDKPSHQVLGAVGLLVSRSFVGAHAGAGEEAPPLPVEKMARSERLWPRMVALLLSRSVGDAEADQRLAAALRSDSEPERILALTACMMPAEDALPKELNDGIVAAFERPVFAEQALAAQSLCQALPLDDLLVLLREQIERDGDSLSVRTLVSALGSSRELHPGSEEERVERMMKVLDVILGAKNPQIESMFVQHMRYRLAQHVGDRYPILERLVQQGQPATLRAILADGNLYSHIRRLGMMPVLLKQLGELYAGGDPEERAVVANAFAFVLASDPFRVSNDPNRAAAAELLAKMLAGCFREGDEDVEAGLALLVGFAGPGRPPFMQWQEWPPPVDQAALRGLGYVNDEAHGRAAVELLQGLYAWGTAEYAPALSDAMEEARRNVMQAGTARHQAMVLCGLVRSRDEAERGDAFAELERRLLEGQVPPDLCLPAVRAMSHRADLVSPRFAEDALKRLAAGADQDRFRGALLQLMIGAARRLHDQHEQHGAPLPAWLDEAAQVGWAMANDSARQLSDRRSALRLYAEAARENATERIEALVRAEDQQLVMRVRAAGLLSTAAPATTLYRDLLAQYDKLDSSLREALAVSAAQSEQAPQAEGFVIKAVKDAELEEHARRSIVFRIRLPGTPALRAALEELKNDDRMRHPAESVLRRWDQEADRSAPQPPTPVPTRPARQNYERELAQLKDVAWKKQDTVQRHLTWYALKPSGLARADSRARRVTRHGGVLGHEAIVVKDVAFGPKKVWLATDNGLIAWDRELKFWTLVGAGVGVLDAPVEKVEVREGKLRVTVRPEGQEASTWECDTETMKWQRVRETNRE